MRGIVKEHTRFVLHFLLSPCFSISFLLVNGTQIALSNKFNSNSVIAGSTSLEERTKMSLEDAAQTRLAMASCSSIRSRT